VADPTNVIIPEITRGMPKLLERLEVTHPRSIPTAKAAVTPHQPPPI